MDDNYSPGWMPIEKRDTAWYLYKEIFICKVRNFQTMTLAYVTTMGVNTSGDEEIDRGAAMSIVTVGLPICRMLDYFERGVEIMVPNPADCKRIYDIVNAHLIAWARIISTRFNPGAVPTQDLIMLDRFASVLYPHAEPFFVSKVNQKLFAVNITGVQTFISRSKPIEQEKPAGSRHNSMANVFRGKTPPPVRSAVSSKPMRPIRTAVSSNSRGNGLNE